MVVPTDLKWHAVKSSNVEAIAYDFDRQTLYVKFLAKGRHPSRTYRYLDCHQIYFESMLTSASKGRFVWRELRDQFPYEEVR